MGGVLRQKHNIRVEEFVRQFGYLPEFMTDIKDSTCVHYT